MRDDATAVDDTYSELIPLARQEINPKLLSRIILTNKVVTTAGMISLGLLAMLISHNNSIKKGWSTEAIISFDIATFTTAILGKTAIVMFFNEPVIIDNVKKIRRGELPDYFKFKGRSFKEHLQWGLNTLLSVNASLFWAGLAQVSFEESGLLLKKFNSEIAKTIGHHIGQWYIYSPFVAASFYANIVGWPGIHSHGYNQMVGLYKYLTRDEESYQLNRDIVSCIQKNLQQIQKELLNEIKCSNIVRSPTIDMIHASIHQPDTENQIAVSTATKISQILNCKPHHLRCALLELNTFPKKTQPLMASNMKQLLALGASAVTIYGFKNVSGLSDKVWGNWGAQKVSTYFGGPAAYFSISEVALITVYPMICNLFDILYNGRVGSALSAKATTFTFFMVAFVGIVGGLANAEQSDLDHEDLASVVIALIASFLLDSFAIFNIFNSNFERKIKNSENTSTETALRKASLSLKDAQPGILDISSSSEQERAELTAKFHINSTTLKKHNGFFGKRTPPAGAGAGAIELLKDPNPNTGLLTL